MALMGANPTHCCRADEPEVHEAPGRDVLISLTQETELKDIECVTIDSPLKDADTTVQQRARVNSEVQHEVVVSKLPHQKWGLDLMLNEIQTNRNVEVLKVKEGGFFMQWNIDNPDKAVTSGCKIIKVNETSAQSDIVKEFQANQKLSMIIQPGGARPSFA